AELAAASRRSTSRSACTSVRRRRRNRRRASRGPSSRIRGMPRTSPSSAARRRAAQRSKRQRPPRRPERGGGVDGWRRCRQASVVVAVLNDQGVVDARLGLVGVGHPQVEGVRARPQRLQEQKVSIGHRGGAISGGESEIGEEGWIGNPQGEAPELALGTESEEVFQGHSVEGDFEGDVRRQGEVVVDVAPHLLQGRRHLSAGISRLGPSTYSSTRNGWPASETPASINWAMWGCFNRARIVPSRRKREAPATPRSAAERILTATVPSKCPSFLRASQTLPMPPAPRGSINA